MCRPSRSTPSSVPGTPTVVTSPSARSTNGSGWPAEASRTTVRSGSVLVDAELVAEVRDRGVPPEVCPSSNVALGLVPSFAPAATEARLRAEVDAWLAG